MKAAIIAAPMTGSGKTTVTLGLLSALKSRGLAVQAFKVGPDFIDPGLHELATGGPSHNLDGWMLDKQTNLNLFTSASAGKDVALVEGVMGLFDGVEGASNAGSTAEMAQWLDLPVILIVDAYPLARTAAAIIHGLQTFDSKLTFAGVIFNRVAGEAHFRILKDAVRNVPVLGWLPVDSDIEIRERHMGLLTRHEDEARNRVDRLGEFVSRHLDIDAIVGALKTYSVDTALVDHPGREDAATPPVPGGETAPIPLLVQEGWPRPRGRGGHSGEIPPAPTQRKRVAIASDPAFSFYYPANRSALISAGAHIIEFSPMRDAALPEADFLYIGGGYPELYRRELSANRSMRESIRRFVESGKPFYAECGGLMYLSRSIEGEKMVGILPTEIKMTDRPVDFGYCEVATLHPSIFGAPGTRLRGHQFHFSRCVPESSNPIYRITQGEREYGEGWVLPNGIASYVHLHFLSNPAVVRHVLES